MVFLIDVKSNTQIQIEAYTWHRKDESFVNIVPKQTVWNPLNPFFWLLHFHLTRIFKGRVFRWGKTGEYGYIKFDRFDCNVGSQYKHALVCKILNNFEVFKYHNKKEKNGILQNV